MASSFDDFSEDYGRGDPVKPLWTVDLKDNEELKKWVKNDYMDKESRAFPRNIVYRKNLCMYKGIQYKSQDSRELLFANEDKQSRSPKVVVNHIFDLVETRVSKLTRFPPAIAVMPANDEYNDKQNARTLEAAIKHRWRDVNIDEKFTGLELITDIFGEGYMFVHWDKQAGDLIPEARRLVKKGKTKITLEDGKEVSFHKLLKNGDVGYRLITPDRLMPAKADCWDDVEHVTYAEYVDIEKLKARYPDKQNDIKNSGERLYDITSLDDRRNFQNEIMVLHIWHKHTEEMPDGAYIVATLDTILEVGDHPYKHGMLPFIRQTDIDIPGELHARSFINQITPIQKHHNHISSGIARNHGIASAPKWVMPKGACDIKTLGNEITVVEFKGPLAPRLERMEPTPREMFEYQPRLEMHMEKLSGIHAVSRGAPPSGIKSGIALQFLDEQENERANKRVQKRNQLIVECAKQTMSLMGQNYKNDDERMIKIIGQDGSIQVEVFNMSEFDDSYDVQIQKSSSLPDQKAIRTQTIMDLREVFPGIITDQVAADLLGFAQTEKMMDIMTVNVRAAQYETEMMNNGKDPGEPKEWEDHIIHYEVHLKDIQKESFKRLPEQIQALKKKHLMVTEYLMIEKAKRNPLFAQKLLQFDVFPVFFDPGAPLMNIIQPPAPPEPKVVTKEDAFNDVLLAKGQSPIMPEATLPNDGIEQAQPLS